MVYIGFDYSIKKTACTVIDNGEIFHYCWPVNVSDKSISMLKSAGVIAIPYKSVKSSTGYSDLMRDVLTNSENISKLICDTLEHHLIKDNVVIAQEGFSYNSKGSSMLDLAGGKYILMHYLSDYIPMNKMYTYAPITVKKTAKCAKKGMGKEDMILAFSREKINSNFHKILVEEPNTLIKKTNFVECVDDIVDSYWVTKTMINDLNNITN